MITTVVLRFTHEKPIPDLAELAAGRAYTLSGVENCEVLSNGISEIKVMVMPEEKA